MLQTRGIGAPGMIGAGLCAVVALHTAAAADVVVLSQSRGIEASAIAREGDEIETNTDRIDTDAGSNFFESLVISAFGPTGQSEASAGAIHDSQVSPDAFSALIAANGVTLTRTTDSEAEGVGAAWFDVSFRLDAPHDIEIAGVIDNLLFNGDGWAVDSGFELRSAGRLLFSASGLGEFEYADTLGPGDYSVGAWVMAEGHSLDGDGLNLSNLRQTFDIGFVAVPAPASAMALVLPALLADRRRRAAGSV